MFVKSEGKFADCAIWQEKPEAARADPKADRIFVPELIKREGWSVDDLNFAICAYGFPKPIGHDHSGWSPFTYFDRAPFYSRKQIAKWRESLAAI